jgi:hypothetical protein
MATSAKLLIKGLYPQEIIISSSARCCLNASPTMLSPMKIVEWLYDYVSPLLILHAQSYLIQIYIVTWSYKYKLQLYIHTYIQHPNKIMIALTIMYLASPISQKSHPQYIWYRDVIIKHIPSGRFCKQPICKFTFNSPKQSSLVHLNSPILSGPLDGG